MASFPDDFEAPTLIEKRDVSPATWDELHATLSEASVCPLRKTDYIETTS
jgi:hypothetical protein